MSLPTHEFLSHPDEVHAVFNGFFVGLTARPNPGKEYEKELHYWRLGFLLGWGVKAALLIALGSALSDSLPSLPEVVLVGNVELLFLGMALALGAPRLARRVLAARYGGNAEDP